MNIRHDHDCSIHPPIWIWNSYSQLAIHSNQDPHTNLGHIHSPTKHTIQAPSNGNQTMKTFGSDTATILCVALSIYCSWYTEVYNMLLLIHWGVVNWRAGHAARGMYGRGHYCHYNCNIIVSLLIAKSDGFMDPLIPTKESVLQYCWSSTLLGIGPEWISQLINSTKGVGYN